MAVARISDRYDVLSRLGAGGMGDVWLADDLKLGRKVAVKFVNQRELRQTPKAHAILMDEARNAGRLLGHPNVVAVLDIIDVDIVLNKGPAVVLEYVDGCNVAEWIASYNAGLDEFTRLQTGLYISASMVEAVAAAHKMGILHRDIKPLNTLISKDGRVKVADFGLSRVVEELTRSHTVWANHTPLYAAPEQWNDQRPDERTDVYQLSATIYHLLAGRPVAEGESIMALLSWHQSRSPRSIFEFLPNLNKELGSAIDQGVNPDPGMRPSLWRLFDTIMSATVQRPVVLEFSGAEGVDDATVELVAALTDYGVDAVRGKRTEAPYAYAHPLEAVREAVGVKLLGVTPTVRVATQSEIQHRRLTASQAPSVPGHASLPLEPRRVEIPETL